MLEDIDDGGLNKGNVISLRRIKIDFIYIQGKRVTRERIGPLRNEIGHLCVEPQRWTDSQLIFVICFYCEE